MPAPIARCHLLLARRRWATTALTTFLAVAGLAGPAASAPRTKKPAAKSPTQTSFEAVLDAQKPAIVACVMEHGIQKGADSVMLDIKVLVNRQGQVFNMELQVNQKGGDKNAMSACVRQALTILHFPASRSALTELRRQWTFAITEGPGPSK